MQPQLVMEKLCFLQDLLEPRDLPSFNAVKITRQTSLNQARKDERRLKTTFNHFRDRPARSQDKQKLTQRNRFSNRLARVPVPKLANNGFKSVLCS
jgi:hypothetical protein